MSRRDASHRGDKAALLGLMAMVVVFVAVVGRGWQALFVNWGLSISISLGLFVAVIATSLAYAIAAERVYHPVAKATALAFFFVLFNISALGTVNAMFVMFQSANIFRDHIDASTQAVVALRDVGAGSIDTGEYERFRANLGDKWRNLKAELENPQLCGQGPVAATRMEELQVLLPSFRPLAGGGRCDKVPVLVASYEKQIGELTKESPIFLANRGKIELKQRVIGECQRLLEEIGQTSKTLSGTFSLGGIKAQLFDIAERYAVLRQEINSGNPVVQDKVPLKLDMRSVSALGDIGQVLPFIASRLTETSTYVYLVIALFLDLTVILAFARVLREGPSTPQRRLAQSVKQM